MTTVNDIKRDVKRKIESIEKRNKESKDDFTKGRLFELKDILSQLQNLS